MNANGEVARMRAAMNANRTSVGAAKEKVGCSAVTVMKGKKDMVSDQEVVESDEL